MSAVCDTLSQSAALLCIKSQQPTNSFQDLKAGKPRRKTATTSFDSNKTFTVISENNTQGAADRQTKESRKVIEERGKEMKVWNK
jgi:hypothetical protein